MPSSIPRRQLLGALSCGVGALAFGSDRSVAQAQVRGWLGIELATVDGRVVARRVVKGSPAERAGVRASEIIVAVDGVAMTSGRGVVEAVAKAGAGATLRLSIERAGRSEVVEVKLDPHPGDEGILRLERVGEFAPSFGAVRAVQGEVPPVERLRGRVVLVFFWASWCGACRATVPSIEAVRARFQAEGLTVVGLTDDDDAKAALAAVKHGITFAVGAGLDSATAQAWGVRALPTMFVVDRGGVVREAMIGLRSADALALAIEPHLRQGGPSKRASAPR